MGGGMCELLSSNIGRLAAVCHLDILDVVLSDKY
jgi:hypothetical protein